MYLRVIGVSALLMLGCMVSASDVADLRGEIEDIRAKIATIESTRMSASTGDAASLTSIRKNGKVQIGGDVNVDIIFKHRDDRMGNTGFDPGEIDSTEFHTNSANLRFKISATPSAYLYIKLDLDDFNDTTFADDDVLEECKFVWNSIRQSNFGLVFGKGEVPYGQDRTLGIIQSYHHNNQVYSSEGPSILLAGTEAPNAAATGNPHQNVGRTSHPGEVDNVFMLAGNYVFKDFLKFEFAVYQANGSRGMNEDRSEDNLAFQSFCGRIWYTPIEGLDIEASFMREFRGSRADRDARTDLADPRDGVDDQFAVSLGANYQFAGLPLEIFGEYQHAWDWNFTRDYDVDIAQLGLVYTPMKPLNLGIMGEWMNIEDDHNDSADEDYYKLVLSCKYRFDNGIYLILEYAHEWYDGDFDTREDNSRDADVVAFRAGWAF